MIRAGSATAERDARAAAEGRCARALREELWEALARADGLDRPAKLRLWSLVGHVGQRLDIGGIGVSPVAMDTIAGDWRPADDGPLALIIPVHDGPNAHGVPLLDLVAWLPRTGAVCRRTGIADLLGAWNVAPPLSPSLVTVHPDPGAWARAGGSGVMVLDFKRAWHVLGHVSRLAVHSVEFGLHLDRALKPPPVRRPEIVVMREAAAA